MNDSGVVHEKSIFDWNIEQKKIYQCQIPNLWAENNSPFTQRSANSLYKIHEYEPTTDKIIENPTGGVVETAEIKQKETRKNEGERKRENKLHWLCMSHFPNIHLNNYHIEYRLEHNKLCHVWARDNGICAKWSGGEGLKESNRHTPYATQNSWNIDNMIYLGILYLPWHSYMPLSVFWVFRICKGR